MSTASAGATDTTSAATLISAAAPIDPFRRALPALGLAERDPD
ncbi:hypothetical protein STRAU_2731 [Streptomyces aurantiacus JA 4570]|uniref:Uncharacterized protein n=1 Tax=Streptomyces aurantiacus JA 4570 TaxID=1286094 RepID=S3ZL87_9ACTN|nr:hypothetical protein STRAU_2731 [Streptomyces aurantiacus JA 4570]